jgi:hypothetical protein
MTVNLEVKGNVARLLATENLIVENKKVHTASFNVETRVLTLPLWQKSSNEVYDLLVAHEVSHALYTPNEDWDSAVPHQFLNVVEDVRVEKLIKRKFAGLSKTFYRGYQQFYEEDFFEVEGKDINKMNLADKINIYSKIGSFLPVTFTEEEQEIVDLVNMANTFDEAQVAALCLYKFCKEESDKEKEEADVQLPNSNSEEKQPVSDSGEESQPVDSQPQDTEEEEDEGQGGTGEQGEQLSQSDDLEVETDTASTNNIQDLVDSNASSSQYLEFADLDLTKIINSNKEVHDYLEDFWKPYSEEDFSLADRKYETFKNSSQKEVNYLVKEFEMKKAASSYARASVSRTGVLDCTKLHTYKYNEDLFKKVTILPDGKNHGLVFVLDWSGSMNSVLEDTVKQLYSLIWFCKKVGIPFGVYTFTEQFNTVPVEYDKFGRIEPEPYYNRTKGSFHISNDFSLMEFFTSNTSQKVLDRQMKNIYRVVISQRHYDSPLEAPRLGLSGTPLNETILTLRQLIPSLQSKWNVEKIQCVMLTDGESNHLTADRWISREEEVYICNRDPGYTGRWSRRRLHPTRDFIRNRKSGVTYAVSPKYWDFTNTLVQCVKDELPFVNFIGIRLLNGRDAHEFIRKYNGHSLESGKLIGEWKKNKSISLKMVGYDAYFGISSNSLSTDTTFDVDEGATKAKIKSAFIKSLKTKKLNKKVLNEFVELIS